MHSIWFIGCSYVLYTPIHVESQSLYRKPRRISKQSRDLDKPGRMSTFSIANQNIEGSMI